MTGLAVTAAALAAIWWIRGRLRPVRNCLLCHGDGRILYLLPCPACGGDGTRFTLPAAIARRRHR